MFKYEVEKNVIKKEIYDVPYKNIPLEESRFTLIDLFAGIGGARLGFQNQGGHTVFSSEINKFTRETYRINYGEVPYGDITKINKEDIPDHDILLASFPCQGFSRAGKALGYKDIKGTIFFEIVRILNEKRPKAFMLENFSALLRHEKGETLRMILEILESLNYYVPYPKVLNSYDFGVPQKRERLIIVGFNKGYMKEGYFEFNYPIPKENKVKVGDILETKVDEQFTVSDKFYQSYLERNKGRYGCLLNEESFYTYTITPMYRRTITSTLLVEQKGKNPRYLTPRECARLQGLPEDFIIPEQNVEAYRQIANSSCVPLIEAVAKSMVDYMYENHLLNENHLFNNENAKDIIKKRFDENVKGKKPDVRNKNSKHDGKYGHWLEEQFGVKHNADNKPDLMGFELKNETKSKTSFGDWSANQYIFTMKDYKDLFEGTKKSEKQDSFLKIFGRPNLDKEGRYSWSGSPCPKINHYNEYGQILKIEDNKDIVAIYSYSHDKRPNKSDIIPVQLQAEEIVIARWYGKTSPTKSRKDKCLKSRLEDKFGKGWFTCKKDSEGKYYKLCFGEPIYYDDWIKLVEQGIVFFDSGMYEGNERAYSQWRANNTFWDSLIIEEYE